MEMGLSLNKVNIRESDKSRKGRNRGHFKNQCPSGAEIACWCQIH